MSGENHFVTPTYQDMFIVTLNAIIPRLMNQDFRGTWEGLKTLYCILPPKCKEDTKDAYGEIRQGVAAIQREDHHMHFEAYEINLKETEYLSDKMPDLLEKVHATLFERGYLENSPTKPRNLQPTTLGE